MSSTIERGKPRAWLRQAVTAVAVVVAATAANAVLAQRVVFIVRHAEKVDESEDAALTKAGEQRAARLASMLRDAGVTAIYTTPYRRTRGTAAPLARALEIEPVSLKVPAPALAERLRRENADDVVLVVGHHNSVTALIEALGHPDPLTIATDEYTNLFVVVPRPSGAPLVLRLRY